MKIHNCVVLLLSMCLLSACDPAPPPAKAPVAPKASIVTITPPISGEATPAASASQPIQPVVAVPVPVIPQAAATVQLPAPQAPVRIVLGDTNTQRSAPNKSSNTKPAAKNKVATKPSSKPVTTNKKALAKKSTAVAPDVFSSSTTRSGINLNLPPEMAKQMPAKTKTDNLPGTAILPPLFKKAPSQAPFQLNGKLLTNDFSRDNRKDIDGAAVEFEFKQ